MLRRQRIYRSTTRHPYPYVTLALLVLPLASLSSGASNSDYKGPGTRQDRKALFTYLVDKTLEREAFSPIKNNKLGLNFKNQAALLEHEFLAADTNEKLYRALLKLSNIRKDRHLRIERIQGGLRPKSSTLVIPIQFAPDFAEPAKPNVFVQRIASNASFEGKRRPEIGDQLLAVNGNRVEDYFEMMKLYLNHSTQHGLLLEFANSISFKRSTFGEELYKQTAQFELKDKHGNMYRFETEYFKGRGPPGPRFKFPKVANRTFPGFRKDFDTPSYAVYRPEGDERVVLLDWHGFPRSLARDLKRLMIFAERNGLLNHDLIIDATHSRGGSRGADVVARITSKPFKTTFGNVRCSDVIPEFTKRYPFFTRVGAWLRTDVAKACSEGKAYSANVPFKLAHLPKDSDGIMQPAPVRFRGSLVCLFSPLGGSHLDQFAAMIIDNDLGHSIGMATGGFSNTWEWKEEVVFPTTKEKVIGFMWSIGHTLRPNGEILEGNPALPKELVPQTRDNFENYYDHLLERALQHLAKLRRMGD